MKKINCIIVDDEPLARELVTRYIGRLKDWEIKASCRSVAEAYEALYQNNVDVIFLDINMPNKTGIEFLSTLKNPPHVVFTTAYAEYAAKAFDLKAVDYLVKPITEERFSEAVEKIERLLNSPEVSTLSTTQETDHVFLKQDNRLVKVMFDDILYVEALKDFSKVFGKERPMLVSAHLKMMEEMLPQSRFLRIHRSYIIALNKITAIQGNVVEVGKQQIPIGITYKDELIKRLGLGSERSLGTHPFMALFLQHFSSKNNFMAENNNRNQGGQDATQNSKGEQSIGNQQRTAQTGAQNAGGENIDQEEDQYTEDLRQSGDRNSSNRKTSS